MIGVRLALYALCCSLLACAGCSRTLHVPVEGLVTLDGKPVNDAAITFIPSAGGRPGLAATDIEGRFCMKDAGMEPGLLPGTYDVIVFKAVWAAPSTKVSRIPADLSGQGKDSPMSQAGEANPKIQKYVVPEKYSSGETSGLSATVTGPTKSLEFNLTTAP